MARRYRIISADSHLHVAAERWTSRVPAKHRDLAPRTVRMPDSTDATVVANGRPQVFHGGLTGLPYDTRTPNLGRFDTAPGVGSPEQRLREQDLDGVDGEIMFTFPAGSDYYRHIKDHDLASYKAVIHAWNQFQAEEYCRVAPDRLMGMGVIPDTGVDDALAEMEYCARMGLKGSACPDTRPATTSPLPKTTASGPPRWNSTCRSPGTCASPAATPATLPSRWSPTSTRSPRTSTRSRKFTMYAVRGAGNAVQMIFNGLFDRFPRLRFYFAETMVGWLPHFLETLDDQYDRHIHWSSHYLGVRTLDRKPSEYVREHFFWGFMRNPVGVRMRHEIGVNRMMWATDFPHAESDWPESQRVIEETFAGVSEEERALMLGGNAIEFFNLGPTPKPAAAQPAIAASSGG